MLVLFVDIGGFAESVGFEEEDLGEALVGFDPVRSNAF